MDRELIDFSRIVWRRVCVADRLLSLFRRSVAEQEAYDPQTDADLYYMHTLIHVI